MYIYIYSIDMYIYKYKFDEAFSIENLRILLKSHISRIFPQIGSSDTGR